MRKIQLRRDLRLASILLCTALILILVVLAIYEYKNPDIYDKKVSLYNYEIKSNIDYEVFLRPNSLYETKSIGEDQVYLANIVDYVNSTFAYEFKGEREAEISGNYEIIAVVEGYTGEEDKVTTLWKKQFPIVSKTSFQAKDKSYSITQNVPLKLTNYTAFAEEVNKETEIKTHVKVTAYMNVELSAKTDQGVIEKKSTTSLEAPINTNSFRISKKLNENKPEAIQEIRSVQQPLNKKLLTGYCVGIGILSTLLLVLILGSIKTDIDLFKKALKKIFKKYGTRLVALDSEIEVAGAPQSFVHSIEDLVRISDELGKPIVYKYSDKYKEALNFWVIDENRYYVFALMSVMESGNSLKKKVGAIENKYQSNGDCKETQVITWGNL